MVLGHRYCPRMVWSAITNTITVIERFWKVGTKNKHICLKEASSARKSITFYCFMNITEAEKESNYHHKVYGSKR